MIATTRFCALLALMILAGCSPRPSEVFQGYMEGEYVYVAAPVGGALEALMVSRGDQVQSGHALFKLDPEPEQSAMREAEQRVVQAEARLANLSKGARPSEIAAWEARLASAIADAEFAKSEVTRLAQLRQESVISADEMDRAQTQREAALATVSGLKAELETARLGARVDEIAAGQAEVEAARAALAQARWALNQKQQFAPTNAIVDDTLYRMGEWVAAGRPVVSLLPPENIKVRFFVPEPSIGSIQQGQNVTVSFDGSSGPLNATVSYLSTHAEFTPPVIYSRENRAKLVYMVEAVFTPEAAAKLHPGQPVDVRVQSEAP